MSLKELYEQHGTVMPWPSDKPMPMPGYKFPFGSCVAVVETAEWSQEARRGPKRYFVAVRFFDSVATEDDQKALT